MTDTFITVGRDRKSCLLIDNLCLFRQVKHLDAKLFDLEVLVNFLTGPQVNSSVIHKELFFCYPQSRMQRDKLQYWAMSNGWESYETRLPIADGKEHRLSNVSYLNEKIARCIISNNIEHIWLISNDLGIEQMLKFAREKGISVSLIHFDQDDFTPFASLAANVDELISPLEIPELVKF